MIPLKEGSYYVEDGLLKAGEQTLGLFDIVITVWADKDGTKRLKGRARLNNYKFAMMLEDVEDDEVDVVLWLGHGFGLYLTEPPIQGGRLMTEDTEASILFSEGDEVRLFGDDEWEGLRLN